VKSTVLLLLLPLLVGLALATGSCFQDVTHDELVSSRGPEAHGVSPGPNHRPGQPCLTCHGGSGPAGQQFSVAGTVYTNQTVLSADGGVGPPSPPAVGATVTMTDSRDSKHTATTNEVGNFYVPLSQWAPVAPIGGVTTGEAGLDTSRAIQVSLGSKYALMYSHVGRDGSCADCHSRKPGPLSPGPIYLVGAPR